MKQFLLFTFFCFTISVVNAQQISKKPNVIFILADDLTTQCITAYGSIYKEYAPTPNIDRLANEGMLFNNVLCTNAICGPSRSCILTGNYSHVNGYFKNESGGQFDESLWTFPKAFQENQYKTALYGKWHLGSEPKGFDNYGYHNSSNQQGVYWDPVYNINGVDQQIKGYATNITTDLALEWIDHHKTQSFMLCLQYKAPHRPWQPDTKYEHLWDDIEMPYPSTFNDDYKGRELTAGDTEMTMDYFTNKDLKLTPPSSIKNEEDYTKWLYYGAKKDQNVMPEGMSYDDARKWKYQIYIKDYLACVKSVDDNIGRVLACLDEHHLADKTMIVLTSDQGFYLGEHGFFDKRWIYEQSIKMPFIVKYPNVVSKGVVNTDIVTNIDFAPTLLDVANIKAPVKMQGESFKSMLIGKKAPKDWKTSAYYHYYEYPYWHHVQPHYGIRTKEFTMAHFYYNIDQWELYDNIKDPQQIHNVINEPAYQKIASDLKVELNKLRKKYQNNMSLPELRNITEKNFGDINERK